MIPETMDLVRRVNMSEFTPPPPDQPLIARRPASTRIIEAICLMEKGDKAKGDHWMAMVFELVEWVRQDERKKLRDAGRLT